MTTIPDYVGALFTHLRADADTVSLADGRISGSMDKWVGMPTYGVLVMPTGGLEDAELGHVLPRVDVWCYGPNRYESHKLWRTVHGYLLRPDRGVTSFKIGTTVVYSMQLEGGPIWLPEQDSGYPRVVGSYIMRVAGVPL